MNMESISVNLTAVKAAQNNCQSNNRMMTAAKSAGDENQSNEGSSSAGEARFSDLCAEDKQRMANLIRELARLGKEKELAEQQLTNQEVSELRMTRRKQLRDQEEQLTAEQQRVTQQLQQCQQLLDEYESFIAQRQKDSLSTAAEIKNRDTDAVKDLCQAQSEPKISEELNNKSYTADIKAGNLERNGHRARAGDTFSDTFKFEQNMKFPYQLIQYNTQNLNERNLTVSSIANYVSTMVNPDTRSSLINNQRDYGYLYDNTKLPISIQSSNQPFPSSCSHNYADRLASADSLVTDSNHKSVLFGDLSAQKSYACEMLTSHGTNPSSVSQQNQNSPLLYSSASFSLPPVRNVEPNSNDQLALLKEAANQPQFGERVERKYPQYYNDNKAQTMPHFSDTKEKLFQSTYTPLISSVGTPYLSTHDKNLDFGSSASHDLQASYYPPISSYSYSCSLHTGDDVTANSFIQKSNLTNTNHYITEGYGPTIQSVATNKVDLGGVGLLNSQCSGSRLLQTSRPLDYLTGRPVDPPISRPLDHQVSKLLDHQVSIPLDHQLSRSLDCLTNRPIDHQIDRLVDHQISRPLDYQISRPLDHQIKKQVNHQTSRPLDQTYMDSHFSRPLELETSRPIDHKINRQVDHQINIPLDCGSMYQSHDRSNFIKHCNHPNQQETGLDCLGCNYSPQSFNYRNLDCNIGSLACQSCSRGDYPIANQHADYAISNVPCSDSKMNVIDGDRCPDSAGVSYNRDVLSHGRHLEELRNLLLNYRNSASGINSDLRSNSIVAKVKNNSEFNSKEFVSEANNNNNNNTDLCKYKEIPTNLLTMLLDEYDAEEAQEKKIQGKGRSVKSKNKSNRVLIYDTHDIEQNLSNSNNYESSSSTEFIADTKNVKHKSYPIASDNVASTKSRNEGYRNNKTERIKLVQERSRLGDDIKNKNIIKTNSKLLSRNYAENPSRHNHVGRGCVGVAMDNCMTDEENRILEELFFRM